MIKSHKINKLNNFISGYYIDTAICDDLITYFKNSNNKSDGKLYGNGVPIVNKSKKASTDLACNAVDGSDLMNTYTKELGKCVTEYKKQYIYSDAQQSRWSICADFNIQQYKPSESYSQWHYEMGGPETIYRHLTFMTYLNTVKEGGETEWYYQKIKVKPEKGLTVIWGTNWQSTHRGIPAPKETKYIATGWFGYIVN